MGVTQIICQYIYDAFQLIKKAIEKIEDTAKSFLKKVQKLLKQTLNIIASTIEPLMDKIKKMIDQFTSSAFNLIFDGLELPLICDDLWHCLAFLQELLDPSTTFHNAVKKSLKEKCLPEDVKKKYSMKNTKTTAGLTLNSLIDDFLEFRDMICNMGFGFEFCIDSMKIGLKTSKISMIDFKKLLNKKLKLFTGSLDDYLKMTLSLKLSDFLQKLKAFFECIIGREIPTSIDLDFDVCAEIQTAQNFYLDVLATLHLVQEGDGYILDPVWVDEMTAPITGMIEYINQFLEKVDNMMSITTNPIQVKVATKSYDNAKYVFPGQMSLSDIKDGSWKKNEVIKYFSTKKDDILRAFRDKKLNLYKRNTTEIKTDITEEEKDGATVITKERTITDTDKTVSLTAGGISSEKTQEAQKSTKVMVIPDNKSSKSKNNSLAYINDNNKKQNSISDENLKYLKEKKLTKKGMDASILAELNEKEGTNKYTTAYILKNTSILNNGTVTVRDGCDMYELDNLPKLSNPIVYEFMSSKDITDDNVIMDGDEVINITEAAAKIATDPDSDLAVTCKQYWSYINNMYDEQNLVQRY